VNSNLFIGIVFFLVGHLLSWYGSNLQFVSPWWKERSVLLTVIIAIPTGLSWFYGTRFIMEWRPELWTSRFVGFSLSYITFPLMTWYYLGESPFTLKTIICTLLAFTIVMVQLFVK
jgi:hypothetical protein|tara:strand:- start:109 stop:456 length:348 start_codon:yes stop_codon:yes gene_type:complete